MTDAATGEETASAGLSATVPLEAGATVAPTAEVSAGVGVLELTGAAESGLLVGVGSAVVGLLGAVGAVGAVGAD